MNRKLRKNQQGFHSLELLLVIAVIVVIGLVGWVVWKKNSSPKLNAAQKVVQSSCLKSYNDTKLCDFGALFTLTNKPYKLVIKTTPKSGSADTITIESDGNGGLSYITSSGDIIKSAGTTYVELPNTTTWYRYAAGSTSAPAVTNPGDSLSPDFKAQAAKKVKYNYISKVSCGTLTCYKYQEVDPTQTGTTTFFWFDTKNYRLQSLTSEDSAGATTDMTVSYESVTITAPATSTLIQ